MPLISEQKGIHQTSGSPSERLKKDQKQFGASLDFIGTPIHSDFKESKDELEEFGARRISGRFEWPERYMVTLFPAIADAY